ncbi:homoserine kinase [bacterium]|nr:homoserine kinase [bacterium]
MKVTVKIPATTANLGPGFDSFGMALPFYDYITVEETVMPGSGIQIELVDYDEDILNSIPTDENNIVYKAIELLYNFIGQTPEELKITIKSGIPMTRGLGSSAAVIVGGLIAANELLGHPADLDALLSIAAEMEGHPDNVAPAILGGFVMASLEDDGSVIYRQIEWPKEWKITVCVPDYELATNISRSVLPQEIPQKDAIFNLKRSAMLIHALDTKDDKLMKAALKDKIHQPYRTKLVPGLNEIIESLKNEEDVLGTVLSGAGPAILVISKGNDLNKIYNTIEEIWTNLNVKVDIYTVEPELKGASIIE